MESSVSDSEQLNWQMKPPLLPEDAPIKLDQSPKFFHYNLEFIDKLMKKDIAAGLVGETLGSPEITAEQTVNLLYRSKLRRRKQIHDESVGKSSPVGFEARANRRREQYAVSGTWLHDLTLPSFKQSIELPWTPLDELKVVLQTYHDHGDHDFTGRYEDVAPEDVDAVCQQLPGGVCPSLSILNYLSVDSPGIFPQSMLSRDAQSKEGIMEVLKEKYASRPGLFGVAPGVTVGRRDQLQYPTDSLSPRLNNRNEINAIDKFGAKWLGTKAEHVHDLSEENIQALNTIQTLITLTRGQLQNFGEHVGPRNRNYELILPSLPITPSSSGANEGHCFLGTKPDDLFGVFDRKAQHNRSSTTRTIRSSSNPSSATKGTTVQLHKKLKRLTPEKLKIARPHSPVSSDRSSKAATTAPYENPQYLSSSHLKNKVEDARSDDSAGTKSSPKFDIVNINTVDDGSTRGEIPFVGTLSSPMPPVKHLDPFIGTPVQNETGLLPPLSPFPHPTSSNIFQRPPLLDRTIVEHNTGANQNTSIHILSPSTPQSRLPKIFSSALPSLNLDCTSDRMSWNERRQEQMMVLLGSSVSSRPSTPTKQLPAALTSHDRFSPIFLENGVVYPNGRKRIERDLQSPSEERVIRRNLYRQKLGLDPILHINSMETTSPPNPYGAIRHLSDTPDSAHQVREVEPLFKHPNEATHDDTRVPYLMNRNGAHTVYSNIANQGQGNYEGYDTEVCDIPGMKNLKNPFITQKLSPSNVYTSQGLSREVLSRKEAPVSNHRSLRPTPAFKYPVVQGQPTGNWTTTDSMPLRPGSSMPPPLQSSHPSQGYSRVIHGQTLSSTHILPVGRPGPLDEHIPKPLNMPTWSNAYQAAAVQHPIPARSTSYTYSSSIQMGPYISAAPPNFQNGPAPSASGKYMEQLANENKTLREIINGANLRAYKAEDKIKEMQSRIQHFINQNGELRWSHHASIQVLLSRDAEISDLQKQVEKLKEEKDDVQAELEHVRDERDMMEVHWQELEMRGIIPSDLFTS